MTKTQLEERNIELENLLLEKDVQITDLSIEKNTLKRENDELVDKLSLDNKYLNELLRLDRCIKLLKTQLPRNEAFKLPTINI